MSECAIVIEWFVIPKDCRIYRFTLSLNVKDPNYDPSPSDYNRLANLLKREFNPKVGDRFVVYTHLWNRKDNSYRLSPRKTIVFIEPKVDYELREYWEQGLEGIE